MTKTITANIPARTIKGTTKTFNYPATTRVFEQDDAGLWYALHDGMRDVVTDQDVIADCKGASNWQAIRQQHFPMYGFHDGGVPDRTPSHKSDC